VVDAVAWAFTEVGRDDDPEAPLGSSSVVLVTHRTLGRSVERLVGLAHQGAVAGIPLSVVGVGKDVSPAEMDRLALAGQGSRRLLDSRSEASRLVERELAAASRVVARAVRLRIRLAPGVRLVDVVGSRALCAAQAQRVREAEDSIDLRLARNLGIASDRGRDEDGVQIVIPSFHAGDSHAILLDVVAPGPGDVADVTIRYKDLVLRRNGVAQARLSLPRGARGAGPLERNVLKNFLAFRLSQTLARAGQAWNAGDGARATALLEEARGLRLGLGALIADLAGDAEIASDARMLGEYVRLLALDAAQRSSQRVLIADSLRYAGRLKILQPPATLLAGAL
jgi:Ca-activated chloride channel family protein